MGLNPQTDRPNHASGQATNSFHERYASDAEFKRQVDEGRRRMHEKDTTEQVKAALNMVHERKKLY